MLSATTVETEIVDCFLGLEAKLSGLYKWCSLLSEDHRFSNGTSGTFATSANHHQESELHSSKPTYAILVGTKSLLINFDWYYWIDFFLFDLFGFMFVNRSIENACLTGLQKYFRS